MKWKASRISCYLALFALAATTVIAAEERVMWVHDDSDESDSQQLLEDAAEALVGDDDGSSDYDAFMRKRRDANAKDSSLQLCLLPSGQLTIVRDSRSAEGAPTNDGSGEKRTAVGAGSGISGETGRNMLAKDDATTHDRVVKRAKFIDFKKRAKYLDVYKRAKFLESGFMKRAKFLDFRKRAKFLDYKRAKYIDFKKRAKYMDDPAILVERGNGQLALRSGLAQIPVLISPTNFHIRLRSRMFGSTTTPVSKRQHDVGNVGISMISNVGRFVKCIQLKPTNTL